MEESSPKKKSLLIQYVEVIAVALFCALIVRAFVAQGYVVNSGNMEKTLYGGDMVLAEKLTFMKQKPKPGDIVAFKYPPNPEKYFVQRCIATEGQIVEIRDKTVYVDNLPFPEVRTTTNNDPVVHDMILSNRDNFGPHTVSENSIFVLGDNRDLAIDSRYWGDLPLSNVKARPFLIYFTWAEDEKQPEYKNLFSGVYIFFYNAVNIFNRIRTDRIGPIE